MHYKVATRIAVILGLSLAPWSPAFAHAALVASSPAKGSTVGAPKTIKLTFSEIIAPAFSGFLVSMSDGMKMSTTTKVSADGKSLTGSPTSPFMKGKYTLSWHATAADDGHRTEGSFDFIVK
jgi:methionine-rich copper-binding protein CopC